MIYTVIFLSVQKCCRIPYWDNLECFRVKAKNPKEAKRKASSEFLKQDDNWEPDEILVFKDNKKTICTLAARFHEEEE